MRIRVAVSVVVLLLAPFAAPPAAAQFGFNPISSRATGENYHVEAGGFFWNPTPDIFITTEFAGATDRIDFVNDLGIDTKMHGQLRVVLRPATKHKFRFEYTPIKYSAESVVRRDIFFNGVTFPLTVEVGTDLIWRAYRFGYEYDFVYRDRGFAGLLVEAKYTDVEATLSNRDIGVEFVRARAPIPAVGFIGRGYVLPNVSITSEFSFFWVPDIDEDYDGNYFDFDLYGTVNFNDNVGAQVGYRSFDIFYKIEDDEGELNMKGLYFGGVVRF